MEKSILLQANRVLHVSTKGRWFLKSLPTPPCGNHTFPPFLYLLRWMHFAYWNFSGTNNKTTTYILVAGLLKLYRIKCKRKMFSKFSGRASGVQGVSCSGSCSLRRWLNFLLLHASAVFSTWCMKMSIFRHRSWCGCGICRSIKAVNFSTSFGWKMG